MAILGRSSQVLLLLVLVAHPCLPRLVQMSKDCHRKSPALRLQSARVVPLRCARTVIFWRRGRRYVYDNCEPGRDIWDRSGLRQQWHASVVAARGAIEQMILELTLAFHLAACVFVVPFLCAVLFMRHVFDHMMPTRGECVRCCAEFLLLFSMWQGLDTNLVAVLAWLAWLLGLHCGSMFSCRCTTWLLVCLSQRELRAVRLIFLSLLVVFAPLFGKRAASAPLAEPGNKKPHVEEQCFVDAYAPSLQCVRSGARARGHVYIESGDLLTDFPFVAEEFMAVLLSIYSPDVLRSVLANNRVQGLEIWIEFVRDHRALGTSVLAEQELFDEYSQRFANILLSLQDSNVKTERQRLIELNVTGRCVGLFRANGGISASRDVLFVLFLILLVS